MKRKFTENLMRIALFCSAVIGLASCTQSTTPLDSTGSNVAMRTQLDNIVIHSPQSITSKNSVGGIDSLQVTSLAYAASNFMVRNDISDDQPASKLNEFIIRSSQFLLAFDLSGRQYIGESIIPPGTYTRDRFDIHPLQGRADSLAPDLGAFYSSLFANAPSNSTVVIHGYIWQSGMQMPFTYFSGMSGGISILFDQPLVVGLGSPMEMLVKFSSQNAFDDGTGAIMDPRDGKNAAAIEANLRTALKASLNNSGS